MPPDVVAQQKKLSQADGLVLIGPILGYYLPAMLNGWLQRVFSFGFAWRASAKGMEGLLKQEKSMLISTTGNPEEFY